ncbi:uncharacterized protein C2845_PM05G00980 [Panicum miliaceum]|uniref:Uncharacterized protein n=1 Tax=Panicum miliaceum TaxID=4540 RepID=A0A3L6SZ24_PANMI|nr:uncharacterized protein C2845_PM05G00980 [Panicum miliaceum]
MASGSRRPPRAGAVSRAESIWRRSTKDNYAQLVARRPEEKLINDYAALQATVRKVAIGLAYLSLTWSTVVLLGGFVSVLKLIDFWFLTAISTSFAVNLADVYEYKIASLLAAGRVYIGLRDDLARAFSSRGHGGLCVAVAGSMLAEACYGVLMIVLFIGLQIFSFAPLGAIFLALRRLKVNSYGNAGGDAANAAKLKASLQIFYSLALAQNVVFSSWSLLLVTENLRASAVSRQCGFRNWGGSLVRRYLRETRTICATEGYVPRDRNLITFAVSLLGSESLRDRRSAVRLLDTFVGEQIPVGPNLLAAAAFKDRLENLMEALEVGDGETRERAARVVVALAGDLRHIDQFPTAPDCIASLLQASEQFPTTCVSAAGTTASIQEEDEAAGRKRLRYDGGPVYWGTLKLLNIYGDKQEDNKPDDDFPYGGPKQLISQGLLIIEKLALRQGNCVHICNSHGLLSKITAPLNSLAFLEAEYDGEWIDILSRSLRIVARLMGAPGEASRGLRNGIASKTQAVANLTRISEGDKFDPALKAAAIEILAELASDKSAVTSLGKDGIKKFVSQLWGIFLAEMDGNTNTVKEEKQQEANRLMMRHKAGEALARMLSVWDAASSSDILEMFIQTTSSAEAPAAELLRHVVGQLTSMLTTNTDRGSRIRAAEILARLCSHFTKHKELPRHDVIQMLTKVLQLIILCIPRETNNGNTSSSTRNGEQQEEKEFMVALLSLAVVICDRMVDEHDFTCAASGDMVLLVTKLKGIIETNNDTTVECLSTVKLSCQLIVSMVQLRPSCTQVFIEQNFKHLLSESSKSLSNLDNCMLFDADYHQVTKTDMPLASLVKQAQECFDKAQELGDGPA